MAHQLHLKKEKYRQWVKAGLGLGYLKEGLVPFCDDVTKQQHEDILDKIKQTKNLPTVTCGQCSWRNLRPDHLKIGKNQCSLGQANCNCCYTSGKIPCPNNVCGAIYDNIITNHASKPPAPNWKNTQSQQWTGDPWSIAKCFINASGYDLKTSAADIDCTGLLHVIINNKYFHNHIQSNLAGANVFSKVRQYRNEIFHSSTMELEEADANTYIDDMIAVLQDGKELNNRKDAQDAVKKLKELKNEDFIVTTENTENVLDEIRNVRKSTESLATKDDCGNLKRSISALGSHMSEEMEEMKRLKTDGSSQKEQSDYEKSKLELQTMLIEYYKEDILRMSAIPLQQEGNLCNVKDVYVRPRMTIESKGNKGSEEAVVLSMSDVFTKDGKAIKSIYVLGEAGSGKSSFCKSLVNYWCLAHSDEGESIEDELSGVKEMNKFKFLFHLPLRHHTDKMKIKEMLEEKYEHPVLKKLLECESRTCLVVLDGLDEWAHPASKRPPERGSLKEYTVITTSRPWKIATLGINDNEIRHKIILKGFVDKTSVKNMIENTVRILNKTFKKDKVSSICEKTLENISVTSLKHTAITLQQLICLWFDDKLRGKPPSRCALYTEMLDLFFDWNKKKYPDDPLFAEMMKKSEELKNLELPRCLINTEVCKSYSYIIHDVSRLAYETLFNNTRETSLSFDSSTFERLKISNEVKSCCLKLGILSEDKSLSLFASRSRRSVISFVHKSFQEYLAAIYIAIRFEELVALPVDSGQVDLPGLCSQQIRDVFSECTTLDKILEQANVFIMLCGLEPRIATSISKYIYDIVTRDKCVLDYRRTISDRHKGLILDIQECILNCTEEVQACETLIQSDFYLGDIFVMSMLNSDHFCTIFENQFISPDSVISFRIKILYMEKYLKRVWKYLKKCRRLEAMHIDFSRSSEIDIEGINYICNAIEGNTSTLKALYVVGMKRICRTVVRRLPDMNHLVALQIENLKITHEDLISLCTFLSDNSRLEQISICDTRCTGCEFQCWDQHEVDLSEHQQLQYLKYDNSVTVTCVNVSKLEIFNCLSLKSTDFVKVFDILRTANKLTELYLMYDIIGSDKHRSYHTVTNKLITLLPLLLQLRELTLWDFTLTDNIMKFPSELKSMKNIYFHGVKMSLTAWRQFIDSVPQMPLPVTVVTRNMCITRDGEEYEPRILWRVGGGVQAAARQYVRDQKVLFNVGYEHKDFNSIEFSTKK
ncbi:uncharacterized protein LOC123522858 [Mercenaria mercenaria]|uniref:uncharacterized protein LOC123522858 n=1 Tax=Mercenaria mercenaria TaxID=6596 RepID=UPI00234F6508|nr:uncharacterized protein LOC123522858 [Mercenaria mercenaria]